MKNYPVNGRIRAQEVRVIGVDGRQAGVLPIAEAIALAEEQGLDLVCVAQQQGKVPVCKVADFGRFRYEATKRERESKRGQRHVLKEVKISPKIGDHDYQVKLSHIRSFLARGDKTKVNIFFRGREITHPELGRRLADRLITDIADMGAPEGRPSFMGNILNFILAPKEIKKPGKKSGKGTNETKAKNEESPQQAV